MITQICKPTYLRDVMQSDSAAYSTVLVTVERVHKLEFRHVCSRCDKLVRSERPSDMCAQTSEPSAQCACTEPIAFIDAFATCVYILYFTYYVIVKRV